MSYENFIKEKSQLYENSYGFDPVFVPDYLFDFQKYLIDWSVKKGRSAIFADCGLGKTPMQLVWAENIVRKTGGNVLIIAPLAVSYQTIKEGEKFGIEVVRSEKGEVNGKITITNYERLHYFDSSKYDGCICDESSAIKAFDGKRRKQVVRFLSKIQYRLLATATAAPNDFIELGVSSEALGEMTQSEMIDEYFMSSDKKRHSLFKDGDFWNKQKYFFKPHSEVEFWRFISSWSRALRMPSDYGFDDGDFILPALNINQHIVKHNNLLPGELFVKVATTLAEQRHERKITLKERCEKVAELVDHNDYAVVWCEYNPEGDYLEKIIPGAVQVAGKNTDQEKEERLWDFTQGNIRVLITKPKIGAWGLNWQHCNHTTMFPSHSFERYYQSIRRFLRFGQKRDVRLDIVTTEGEASITKNLERKQIQSEIMFESIVREMKNPFKKEINFESKNMELPQWIR